MSASKTKVALLVGALILFVLLFIAPKQTDKSDEGLASKGASTEVSENATLEVYVNMATKNVDAAQKKALDAFLAEKQFDSIAQFWNKLRRPDLAAFYAEQKAKQSNIAEDWFSAGNRYYFSVQFTKDQSEIPVLYQSAIRSFNAGLKINPNDTDARIMLASSYVEGSGDPMKGVALLREIEKTDSNNVKLQITFAFFSVKSAQLDKAESRFKKVLKIDSNYIEAYLHLADLYEQQNKTENTIEMLEQYVARSTDMTARMEVKKYIQQLKESK